MDNQPTPNIPLPQQQPPLPQPSKEQDTNRKLKRWNIIIGIIDVILLLLLIFWPKQCNLDDIDAAVEEAGGNTGYMGMKLVWNDEGQHISVDFDAHALEPNGNHIYYKRHNQNKGESPTALGGYLDVDMLHNHFGTCAVNILWPSKEKLADGHTITVDGIGRFRLRVESKGVDDPNKFSIKEHITRIVCGFLPSGHRDPDGRILYDFCKDVKTTWQKGCKP